MSLNKVAGINLQSYPVNFGKKTSISNPTIEQSGVVAGKKYNSTTIGIMDYTINNLSFKGKSKTENILEQADTIIPKYEELSTRVSSAKDYVVKLHDEVYDIAFSTIKSARTGFADVFDGDKLVKKFETKNGILTGITEYDSNGKPVREIEIKDSFPKKITEFIDGTQKTNVIEIADKKELIYDAYGQRSGYKKTSYKIGDSFTAVHVSKGVEKLEDGSLRMDEDFTFGDSCLIRNEYRGGLLIKPNGDSQADIHYAEYAAEHTFKLKENIEGNVCTAEKTIVCKQKVLNKEGCFKYFENAKWELDKGGLYDKDTLQSAKKCIVLKNLSSDFRNYNEVQYSEDVGSSRKWNETTTLRRHNTAS